MDFSQSPDITLNDYEEPLNSEPKASSSLSGSPAVETSSPDIQVPCVICRKRKVKCNKELPCQNCRRLGFECSYDDTNRGPKRLQRSTRDTAELSGRMARLESLVRTISKQPGLVSKPPPLDPSLNSEATVLQNTLVASETARVSGKVDAAAGKLVSTSASSRHVVSSFWAGLFDEIDNLKFLIDEEELAPYRSGSATLYFSSIGQASGDLVDVQTTSKQADTLYNLYFKNIDPFIKLLHGPRFFHDLAQFRRGTLNHSIQFEALLLAMCYITVMSLDDNYVAATYAAETRATLLDKYHIATEQALARSSFIQGHSLMSLQAFLLYLACLFEQNEHTQASALLGLALRIARRIGIHRDGRHYSLSPWSIEMRRRTWHLLRILDVKALESQGAEPETFELESDTSLPQNSDDASWDPCEYSPKAPQAESGFTEMTFTLVQSELTSLLQLLLNDARSLPKDAKTYVELRDNQLQQAKERIQIKYLNNVDMKDPIQRMTFAFTDLTFCKIWLMIHQPLLKLPYKKGEVSQDLKDRLFLTAIGVCETSHDLEIEYRDLQWDWVIRNSIQWHAIAIILTNLLHRADDPDIPRAWAQIDIIFEKHNNGSLQSGDAALWRPLRRLWAEATLRRKGEQTFNPEQPQVPMEVSGQLQDGIFDQWWDPAGFDATIPDFPV